MTAAAGRVTTGRMAPVPLWAGTPGPGGRLGWPPCASVPRRERPASRSPAHASQLGPGGVEVTLGALGPGAQLATRLFEHLGA